MAELIRITEPSTFCASRWEEAYLRFESPTQEVEKFKRRLLKVGFRHWSSDAEIVEIFCGRGNGLVALASLGFSRLEGVDLSERLLQQYAGGARMYVADCTSLPFESASRDVIIVQGGLHHLNTIPEDLRKVIHEVCRVLRPGGKFVAVEPWLTPFLRCAHFACNRKLVRSVSRSVDALAVMIEEERETYERWLSEPAAILDILTRSFHCRIKSIGWGKLTFVGEKQ